MGADPRVLRALAKKAKAELAPVLSPVVEKKVKVNLDLNKDGKVDKKDASIASKVMNAVKKGKKK